MQSEIFRKPNALQGNTITIKGKGPSVAERVPKGVRCPKTFDKVGRYLAQIAIDEIRDGKNPHFEPGLLPIQHAFAGGGERTRMVGEVSVHTERWSSSGKPTVLWSRAGRCADGLLPLC